MCKNLNKIEIKNAFLTLPVVSFSSKVIIRIVVVFPAPLCPNNPSTSPEFTANDKFRIASFLSLFSLADFLFIRQFILVFVFGFTNSFRKFYITLKRTTNKNYILKLCF